jgi:hypothetical protein
MLDIITQELNNASTDLHTGTKYEPKRVKFEMPRKLYPKYFELKKRRIVATNTYFVKELRGILVEVCYIDESIKAKELVYLFDNSSNLDYRIPWHGGLPALRKFVNILADEYCVTKDNKFVLASIYFTNEYNIISAHKLKNNYKNNQESKLNDSKFAKITPILDKYLK